MKQIIHMSDLHVGYEDLGDRFRTIVNRLIFEKGDKADNYVIIITGDLVDNANNPLSYDEVKSGLVNLNSAGFKYILVVPGNHDYGTGSNGDPKFIEAFKKCFYKEIITYPKLDIIDNIAFLGLDSMAEELHWYDDLFAQGELGSEQLGRLKKLLGSQKVRNCEKRVVYLHHHPFAPRPFHELKDSSALREIIEGKVDAILYGHNHQGQIHNGQWQIKRCYDAGTATIKGRSEWIEWLPWFRVKSAVRMIHIGQEDVQLDYILELL